MLIIIGKNYLPKLKKSIYRIAIIGAESTGKSELVKNLASFYNTNYVAEYSRNYITSLKRKYGLEDVKAVVKNQFEIEIKFLQSSSNYIFCDTEFILSKVWLDDVYKTNWEFLTDKINSYPYDFYLLTQNDIDWVADNVRENGHRRDFFYNWYKQELIKHKLPFTEISGFKEDRLKKAISEINLFFKI